MDRVLNSKDEKQTIYEIYRACRLCGAGAGYKMPIIQNVVELDGGGIELRQKIKECVQIEVNHTDRMPPLICELCVDKVNDFYQFLDMCKENNRRTRQRLGLPLHTPTRDSADSENCILGVTEPVFVDSDTELRNKNKSKKSKVKKETVEVRIKTEPRPSPEAVSAPPPPPPPRPPPQQVRWSVTSRTRRPSPRAEPRRPTRQTLEPVITPAQDMLIQLERKLKRTREKDTPAAAPPTKRTKIPEPLKIPVNKSKIQKELPKTRQPQTKPLKNIRKSSPTPKITPKSVPKVITKQRVKEAPRVFICQICNVQTKTSGGLIHHQIYKHIPAFTSAKNACNACELWFSTTEEAVAHHKHHRSQNVPYKCTRCYGYFKLQQTYEDHFGEGQCLSEYEVPDASCPSCWRSFPTSRLLEEHRCAGADGRPGGKCVKCKRTYALLKNLVKHESTCTHKGKGDAKESEGLRADLLPMQVVIARCDPLLTSGTSVYCGALSQNYGLDPSRHYPYMRARIKTEPPMVAIDEDIKLEFTSKVDTLSALCLQLIQAKRLKDEPFEDMSAKIDSIIDHLANEEMEASCGSDSILNKNDVTSGSSDKNVDSNSESSVKDIDSITKDDESISIVSKNDVKIGSSVKNVDSKSESSVKGVDSTLKDEESISNVNKNDANRESSVKNDDSNSESSVKGVDSTLKDEESISNVNKNDANSESSVKNVDSKIKDDESISTLNKNDANSELSVTDVDSITKGDEPNIIPNKNDVNSGSSAKNVDSNSESSVKDIDSITKDDESAGIVSKNDVNSESSIQNVDSITKDTNCAIRENGENKTDFKDSEGFDSLQAESVKDKEVVDDSIDNASECSNHDNTDNLNKENSSNVELSLIQDKVTDLGGNTEEFTQNENESNIENNKLDITEDKRDEVSSKNDKVDSIDIENVKLNNHVIEVDENKDRNENTSICESEDNEFSKIDEITNKILEDAENTEVNSGSRPSEVNSDSRNGVDSQDKFNVNDLSEDDRKLMAELDEQIGDDDQKISEIDQRVTETDQRLAENDQKINDDQRINESQINKNHYIEELMKKQDSSMKSMDLDNISDDEFNFDI